MLARASAVFGLVLLAALPAVCQLRPDEITAPANDDAQIKELLRDALEISGAHRNRLSPISTKRSTTLPRFLRFSPTIR